MSRLAGSGRKDLFRGDRDRRHWLELLPELVHLFRLRLHAYLLMEDHYHLLMQAPEGNLSRG